METRLSFDESSWERALDLAERDIGSYSPLQLAYLGDAVYEIAVRMMVLNHDRSQVNLLHKHASGLVKASSQAALYLAVEEILTEEEKAVYRRGRNAHSYTMPKHATMKDYRMATGFESLVGYLFLLSREKRLLEILAFGFRKTGEIKNEQGLRKDDDGRDE